VIGDVARPWEVLAPEDPRWWDFVARCPSAGPFHHPAWSTVLTSCYRFRPFALARIGSDGTVTAGLPVLETRSPLGERRWVSLPFSDDCAPLVAPGHDVMTAIGELSEVRRAHGISWLEVHHSLEVEGAHRVRPAARHTLCTNRDADVIFASFNASTRRNIRQAERQEVTVRWATDPDELVRIFYGLHVRTRRRLGVPVQPRRLFAMLWEHMVRHDLASVAVARAGGTPIAASVFLHWNGTFVYKYGASDATSWRFRPNNAVLWHAIRWAAEHGYTTFDFGLTDDGDEGLRTFKRGFGADEEPASCVVFSERPPSHSAGDLGRTLRPVLQRLPLWVTRAAGALFYRFAA
jgi:CelD/BcsL family acetyltransferase involved in cellulose biosynthesis